MHYVRHNNTTWIKDNEKFFLPPVCNKMMHGRGQLKVFYVGGPNIRKDFHMEEGEEFFYMVKGDMDLVTLENNSFKHVHIKEGQVFMLPAKIPHSPQRFENTIGLVIERDRQKQEKDCLRYYVNDTTETLFEKWFYCEDLGAQLVPVITEYFASEQHKTGKPIPGTITGNPPFIPDSKRVLEEPFYLEEWIAKNREEINSLGHKKLFNGTYETEVSVCGQGSVRIREPVEHWIWQIEGESLIKIHDEEIKLEKNDSILIHSFVTFTHDRPAGSVSLFVKMDPQNKVSK